VATHEEPEIIGQQLPTVTGKISKETTHSAEYTARSFDIVPF